MIELRDITKSYRLDNGERRYIFRNLSFTFPDGANIGLIGRNGAGKSTLMRIIGGIDTPDSGKVITDKRLSWPVGLSGMQGSLTGRDSVKFICRVYGTTHEEMLDRVRFVEDFAELGDYFDQPVKFYSSGMRSRLNFGMSLAFDFDYYLMDEVGAVGDVVFKEKSRKILRDRIDTAHVILVSHNMSEIAKLCNVVVLVQDGRAILYEDVREGIDAYQKMAGKDPAKRGQAKGAREGKLAGVAVAERREARQKMRQLERRAGRQNQLTE